MNESLNEGKFEDNYNHCYVEIIDGNPAFAYDNYQDAVRGLSYDKYDSPTKDYTIMKLDDGVYTKVEGWPEVSVNESLNESADEGLWQDVVDNDKILAQFPALKSEIEDSIGWVNDEEMWSIISNFGNVPNDVKRHIANKMGLFESLKENSEITTLAKLSNGLEVIKYDYGYAVSNGYLSDRFVIRNGSPVFDDGRFRLSDKDKAKIKNLIQKGTIKPLKEDIYRQYEDPYKLENQLKRLTKYYEENPDEYDDYVEQRIAELKDRINFAWQDDEYDQWNESLTEKLIEPSKEVQDRLERLFDRYGFKIDGKGKTIMGSIHYQIRSDEVVSTQDELVEFVEPFIEDVDSIENMYDASITWNFGADEEGHVTAGIDIHKQRVADENESLTVKEALNKLDIKCLDENLKYYDLRNLFEATQDRMDPQKKQELRNKLNDPNASPEDVYKILADDEENK